MPNLPTGTVTLLFTDIEGSTRLLQQLGEHYADVLADCRHLLRSMFQQYHGHEVDTQGDAFFVAFARATDAISAAIDIQRALAEHAWPDGSSVRVRIGLHTGEPMLTAESSALPRLWRQRAARLGALLASGLTEQSLMALQEINNLWERAYPLVLFGQLTLQQGEQAEARDLFEESRISFKEAGDQAGMAEALIGLASVATMQGDFASARKLYQKSFQILQRIQYKELIPPCLEGLATVAAEQGELVWAAHLWGAAEALREAVGTPPPVYRPGYQQAVAARSQLGATAWAQGRSMGPEQAIVVRTTQQQENEACQ